MQKTEYDVRIMEWSSDVRSSDRSKLVDTCIPSTSTPLFRAEEEGPMESIPLIKVDELTGAQRDDYDNKPGGKLNLSRLLAHAVSIQPGIGLAVQGMMTGIEVRQLVSQLCECGRALCWASVC